MSRTEKPKGSKDRKARASSKQKHAVEIRMYNVGFGDCFLLRLPTEDGERRMLVDCGYHSQGKGAFTDAELVSQVKADLRGEPLDVVVATHRHQDHISGFGETEQWKGIAVDEVWLPFTASPGAATIPALAAWERLIKLAPSLIDENAVLRPSAMQALGARSEPDKQAVAFMLWNARENAPEIANLRSGLKRADGSPSLRRYLPSGGEDVPFRLDSPALPGVVVHVLGPSSDPAFRGKRKAPGGWGVSDAVPGGMDGGGSPFGPEWRIPTDCLPAASRLPFLPKSLQTMRLFNDDLMGAAAAVDGFLNGESLVLVLEVGAARLLFTGDAEVSSWMKILGDPRSTALAAGATFFKCGHHGSHNATPLVFLKDHLRPRTPVMMSTQEGPGPYRNGIPRCEILDILTEKSMPLARSDRAPAEAAKTPFAWEKHARWVDCTIPC